ncbi:MAG: hypothetical protein WC654_08290 [Patescibacteria group bacterium]
MTNKQPTYAFANLLRKNENPKRDDRIVKMVEPILRDGNTLMLNAQIFRAIMNKAPSINLFYQRAKQIVKDKTPNYTHHEVFAAHPWLVPFVMAVRAGSANAWSEKAYVNYSRAHIN